MSIDEAIAHAKEKAYEHKERAKHFDTVDNKNMCLECAEEHDQLAEWLIQLKEYQTLEEQDRLIKLPCKVGDTVYAIIYDYEVEQYAIKESEIIEVRENINGMFFVSLINKPAFKFNDFGKTVFLTKSEAKAKLKELRGSND